MTKECLGTGQANMCQLCQKLQIVMSDDLYIKVSASSLFTLVSVAVMLVPVGLGCSVQTNV